MKFNCWEILQCGREEGGANVGELGICKASTEKAFQGTNEGKNGGRYCWHVSGTLCDGQVQSDYLEKTKKCMKCKVFEQVKKEEAEEFEY